MVPPIIHPTSLDNVTLASSSSSGPLWPSPWLQHVCYPRHVTSRLPSLSLCTDSSAVQLTASMGSSHSPGSLFPTPELAAALIALELYSWKSQPRHRGWKKLP